MCKGYKARPLLLLTISVFILILTAGEVSAQRGEVRAEREEASAEREEAPSGCGYDQRKEARFIKEKGIDLREEGRKSSGPPSQQSLLLGEEPHYGEVRILPIFVEVAGRDTFTSEELTSFPRLFYDLPGVSPSLNEQPRLKRYLERDSFGQASVLGPDGDPGNQSTFLGPYTISQWDCTDTHGSAQTLVNELEALVDFSSLATGTRLMIFFPSRIAINPDGSNCWYDGVSTWMTLTSQDFVGELETVLTVVLEHEVQTWLHELGHGFGAGHAGRAQCDDYSWHQLPLAMNTAEYQGTSSCGSAAYSDFLGYMGNDSAELRTVTNSNAIHKSAFGWLSEDLAAPHRIERVTESGTYNLVSSSEETVSGLKALRVKVGQNTDLVIEFRSPLNQDGTPTFDAEVLGNSFLIPTVDESLFLGAMLTRSRRGFGHTYSLLFDADRLPTEPDLMTLLPKNFTLPFGQSYTEPNSGTIISVGSSASNPIVEVVVGRQDFKGPVIEGPFINLAESTNCLTTYYGSVIDEESEVISAVAKFFEQDGDEAPFLPISLELDESGNFQFQLSNTEYHSRKVKIFATDNASAPGIGNAPNNTTVSPITPLASGDYCNNPPSWAQILTELNPVMYSPFPVEILFYDDLEIRDISMELAPVPTGAPILFEFHMLPLFSEYLYQGTFSGPPGMYRLVIAMSDAGNPLHYVVYYLFEVRERPFLRGDANRDGTVDIADAMTILSTFLGGEEWESLVCQKAADANDDGAVDIADPIYLLDYLLGGGSAPPEPFPQEGPDLTSDELTCDG